MREEIQRRGWRSYLVRICFYFFVFCLLAGILLTFDSQFGRGWKFLLVAAVCWALTPIKRLFCAWFLAFVALRTFVGAILQRQVLLLPVALVSAALFFVVLRFWPPNKAEEWVHFPATAEEAFPDILTMGGIVVVWVWLDFLKLI